jgi:hypothetical protein
MDGGTVTVDDNLELSLQRGREHRDDMARWLAVEVLLNDPEALGDPTLESCLYGLQDKIEAKLRTVGLASPRISGKRAGR